MLTPTGAELSKHTKQKQVQKHKYIQIANEVDDFLFFFPQGARGFETWFKMTWCNIQDHDTGL